MDQYRAVYIGGGLLKSGLDPTKYVSYELPVNPNICVLQVSLLKE